MNKLTLEDIAQHVYLNKTYISQMFMKHLGVSFVSYLEGVRIQKACELLRDTDLCIAEIASSSGYSSSSYFTKVFKKHTGLGPVQYRNQAPDI